MIPLQEIREKASEWSLRDDVVEKDYVLGWLLWGIAAEPRLAATWIFKGGTCLKKCYLETYRFSEDLDFTLQPGAPAEPAELRQIFTEIADRIYQAAGIEFPRERIRFESYRNPRGGQSIEGRLSYRGPRNPGGDLPRVKIDATPDEILVLPPEQRVITHPYSDGLPEGATALSYGLVEVFGEKLRALAERTLPRDLYDVVNIFRREDMRGEPHSVRGVFARKCQHHGLRVPTLDDIAVSPRRGELESEWANMLGHQLPELPPIAGYLEGLGELFRWLEERAVAATPLPAFPTLAPGTVRAAMPPTVASWPGGAPLERVRFAAMNQLCIDLRYGGTVRRIEPYSLRQSKDGNLILYAVHQSDGKPRSYRVDKIEGVTITRESFSPRYPIEFSTSTSLR